MKQESTKEDVLAAGRRVLAIVAAWTNQLFDGGAGRRITDLPLPPDGTRSNDPKMYREAHSAGSKIEDSIVISNLDRAHDFTRTGQWRGTGEELVGVVDALEPFRVLLEYNAIRGPYTDELLDDADRDILLTVLNQLLARRQLLSGWPLNLPQIAMLAGLSEKSVRMAATGRDRNPRLLMTYKDGAATRVKAEEAERWLARRPTYKPTRVHGDVKAISLVARTNHQLATLFSSLRERAKLSIEDLGRRMEWNSPEVAVYSRIEEAWWSPEEIDASMFDVPTVARLARALEIEPPIDFVRAVSTFFLPYQIEQQVAASVTRLKGTTLP